MNACTVCKYITNKERCPVCGNPTSDNWSGLLIILPNMNYILTLV